MEQMYKLIVSNNADDDLAKIGRYLSKSKLKKLSETILKKYENIRQMPHMYQRLYYEKKTKTDYRRIVCKNYIVTYKIYENQITILRIVSEKENYLKSSFLKLY